MQATIDTMFVNEKIIRIYSFVHPYHETQDKCILRGQKSVTPPPVPLKYSSVGEGVFHPPCVF